MAKQASKSGKATSNLDVVNVELKASFEAVLNLEAELSVYEKAVKMLEAGTISVRGLKATIEASMEKGALPTIKPSTAQYFVSSSKVRALEGGKSKALKDVLNVTIQAKRAFGKDFEAKVSEAETFAAFAKSVPSQGERAKAGRKSEKPEALVTADAVVSFFIGAITELEDIAPKDAKQWEKFLGIVKSMSQATRANHPAVRSKVSA
jgi:hypothetical protein